MKVGEFEVSVVPKQSTDAPSMVPDLGSSDQSHQAGLDEAAKLTTNVLDLVPDTVRNPSVQFVEDEVNASISDALKCQACGSTGTFIVLDSEYGLPFYRVTLCEVCGGKGRKR